MNGCERYREQLTAAADGALSWPWRIRLSLHLDRCPACATLAARSREFVAAQRELLPRLGPDGLDVGAALAAAKRDLKALGAETAARPRPMTKEPRQPWLWLAVGGATAMLLLASSVASIGGIDAVLVPLGMEAPPKAVAKRADLFYEYDLIRRLDALENFEAVREVPLGKKKARAGKARET